MEESKNKNPHRSLSQGYKSASSNQRVYRNSIMTKNVTDFRHLMKNPHATQHDITWAINLREYKKKSSGKFDQQDHQGDGQGQSTTTQCSPPDVYHKKTKIMQIREQQRQQNLKNSYLCKSLNRSNNGEFLHMMSRKFGGSENMISKCKVFKHSSSAIDFFSSLRSDDRFEREHKLSKMGKARNHNKQNEKLHHISNGNSNASLNNTPHKQFSCVAYKDKHKPPMLLKKNIEKDDFESANDGLHMYPAYTDNILKTKNYALLKNLAQIKGGRRISLPGLAWQVGLRNY